MTIHLAFIDFTKAFDLVNRKFMLQARINYGVSNDLLKLIQEICSELKVQIVTDVEDDIFNNKRGSDKAIRSHYCFLTVHWMEFKNMWTEVMRES